MCVLHKHDYRCAGVVTWPALQTDKDDETYEFNKCRGGTLEFNSKIYATQQTIKELLKMQVSYIARRQTSQ